MNVNQHDVNGVGVSNDRGAIGPDGISSIWEFVTPEIAKRYLATSRRNRQMVVKCSERYASDMRYGLWVTTHEGVAFDSGGSLVDGQHRLAAVELSGVGQWMLITRGMNEKSIEVINRGKMRSLAHNLQILGYSGASTRMVAVAKVMMFGAYTGGWGNTVSDQVARAFIDDNIDAIMFAVALVRQNVSTAVLAGVIGRAYYHAPHDRLERFILAYQDVLDEEDVQPGDSTARRLSRFGGDQSGVAGRAVFYRKCQTALVAFLAGKSLAKIYEASQELFPLPKEKQLMTKEDEAEELALSSIIGLAKKHESLSVNSLADAMKINAVKARMLLSRLCDKGQLEAVGGLYRIKKAG